MRNEKRVKVTAGLGAVVALLLVAATPLGHPALRLKASPSTVWDDSDPTVLVEGTHTYLFGSSNNRKVPVRQITSFSSSLATSQADWAAHSVDAMPTRPAWVNPAKWQIWAPSVIKIGTQFLMYFASHNAAATTDMNNDQCIGRAVSSSPMGPYRPSAAPLYCGLPAEGAVGGLPASNRYGRGALDPDVFLAHDGHLYLIVALSRTSASIGEVPLSAGGVPTGGLNTKANTLAGVSLPWQDGTDNTTLTPGSFLENPSMIYEPQTKTYLLFYSGAVPDVGQRALRCRRPDGVRVVGGCHAGGLLLVDGGARGPVRLRRPVQPAGHLGAAEREPRKRPRDPDGDPPLRGFPFRTNPGDRL